MRNVKFAIVSAALALGVIATPAIAQQSGLVNVEVGDVLTGDILSNNRVGIGVAANIAANVCGVTAQVGVIARQVAQTGGYSCENETTNQFVQILR